MSKIISRKEFLVKGAAGAAAFGLAPAIITSAACGASPSRTLRIGFIGTGKRGTDLVAIVSQMKNVEIPAICDIDKKAVAAAQEILAKDGRPAAEEYSGGEEDYLRLVSREDLDAVFIASPWQWHTPMAVAAMKAGKYTAVEVPACLTVEECWDLVRTCEQTGVPCMMLENDCYNRRNLAVLNMIRKGLLGEIVHCHTAHSHNCIDHWFFTPEGELNWASDFLIKRNCDQYPTHSQAPVMGWMNIGCGDYYARISSTSSRSRGINTYFARKFGPDHPNAKRQYMQGDIVTSLVTTALGNTIVINYDMQLPRPFDDRWMVQGTLGLYDLSRNSVYLEGVTPQYHEWESFDPYQEKYDHVWWRELQQLPTEVGHGGIDYLEIIGFLDAVRNKTQTPIDVYDSALMSSVVALSEKSIQAGGAPVDFPDFTGGKWKTRKPSFALEM